MLTEADQFELCIMSRVVSSEILEEEFSRALRAKVTTSAFFDAFYSLYYYIFSTYCDAKHLLETKQKSLNVLQKKTESC